MDAASRSPINLALKILSVHYREALGEAVTDADVDEIRKWAGAEGEPISAQEAACRVIRMELAREGKNKIQ